MPEITFVHIGMLTAAALIGVILGWVLRSSHSKREKISITAGWQAQMDSRQSEHERLAEQNTSLMEQVSQYQASSKDSKMRAKELSTSIKEALARRDELQRQMKDIRTNLEVAISQRDKFKSNVDSASIRSDATAGTIKEKDKIIAEKDKLIAERSSLIEDKDKQIAEKDNLIENKNLLIAEKNNRLEETDKLIATLQRDIANWQDRVPPLVQRFRERNIEAQELEIELKKANDQIATLEGMSSADHTRIEPVDSSTLPDGLDASNEPHTETSVLAESIFQDPVDEPDDDSGEETVDETVDDGAMVEDDEHSRQEVAESEADGEADFSRPLDDRFAAGMFEHDDLRQIKGIGPSIEKTLHDLGIFRFNQIAEMSEYDIDRVAQQVKGFRSRIYREDWIGQARTLQYQKNHDNQAD